MTDFAFETEIPVRYRDLDTYGHVNNANFATFLEEARIDYFEEVLDLDQQARGMVLVSLSIEFQAPIELKPVTVGLAITHIGETSFAFEYELETDGRTVATAKSVQVAYDVSRGEKMAFPEEWRDRVTDFEGSDIIEAPPEEMK